MGECERLDLCAAAARRTTHCLVGGLERECRLPGHPRESAQPAQAPDESSKVGVRASQVDGTLGGDHPGGVAGEVQLDRQLLPQVRPVPFGGQGFVLEHGAVVGDRHPVRPRPGGLAGGPRRLRDHGSDVSAGDRMMDEAAGVGIAESEQGVQDPAVENRLTRSRDRSQHCHPAQLVSERHRCVDHGEQTRLLGRGQGFPRSADERGGEAGFDRAGDHGELLDQVACFSGSRARRATTAPTTDRGVVVSWLARISVTR